MALTKYKLGDLLQLCEAKNENLQYDINSVKGISIQKVFIETKADMTDVSLSPYYLVNPDDFAYVTVTSRNGEKITLAHNTTNNTYIVSSSYVVFRVKRTDLLLSDFLFIYFNRPEFDRYARFNSWGSARETFNWEDMCDIELELPSIEIQQKYVNIYKAMVENQKSYECGLDDLKLVCDGYFDKAKKEHMVKLGDVIKKLDERNYDYKYDISYVRGINNKKEFTQTKADITDTDLSKFLIIRPNSFAYNSRTDGRDMLVLALNRNKDLVIVTWNYNAFCIKDEFIEDLNPEYLYAYFKRSEFDRLVRFMSWGSSQELLTWDNLCDIRVPFPNIAEQNSITNISIIYQHCKSINEKLKEQIKNICPILIKGSIEEAKKEA